MVVSAFSIQTNSNRCGKYNKIMIFLRIQYKIRVINFLQLYVLAIIIFRMLEISLNKIFQFVRENTTNTCAGKNKLLLNCIGERLWDNI
jgi:hypothetical protein